MTRVLLLLLVVGCGTAAPSAPPAVLETPSPPSDPLVDADRAFAASLAGPDTPTQFRRALAAYRRACRAGRARGCWMAMSMASGTELGPYQAEIAQLARLCRGGEHMACRALQRHPGPTDALRPGDPGYAGSRGCIDRSEPGCSEAIREQECNDGFPRSCLDWRTDRAKQLALEGCLQGIVHECDGDSDPEAFLQRCRVYPIKCLVSHWSLRDDADFALRQRALAERACMIGSRRVCVGLALVYAWGHLEQPVPGRARELVERYCTPADIATEGDPCHELDDQLEALAKLP